MLGFYYIINDYVNNSGNSRTTIIVRFIFPGFHFACPTAWYKAIIGNGIGIRKNQVYRSVYYYNIYI